VQAAKPKKKSGRKEKRAQKLLVQMKGKTRAIRKQ
jgi:hypothetical protein